MRSKFYVILVMVVLLVCGNFNPEWGYSHGSVWWTHFTFHFAHGNIFHLAANTLVALSVVMFRNDKWWWWVVSYIVATLCSFLVYADNTTIGMSAIIFVYYGIIFLKDGVQLKPLLYTIAFMLVSLIFHRNVSVGLHAISLVFGATIGSFIAAINEMKSKEKRYE